MDYKFCPGWPEYALGDDGIIYSFKKGFPSPLKTATCISLHHDGKVICLKPSKFRFCCENQIEPSKIDGRKYIITKDFEIYVQSQWQVSRNKQRREKQKKDAIERLNRTKEFTEKCIDYLMGRSCDILNYIGQVQHERIRHYLRSSYTLNNDLIDLILGIADEQFMDALERGKVVNPVDWYYSRCRGLALDIKKNRRRIYE